MNINGIITKILTRNAINVEEKTTTNKKLATRVKNKISPDWIKIFKGLI
jgi:hypothetical protein